ncbi:MAG: hypothetical protein ABI353_02365 [Isosphaeraceae bacterium]
MDEPPLFDLDDLPDDLRGRIKAELVPGERLLWAAQAIPRQSESLGCYLFGGLLALAAIIVSSLALSAYFGFEIHSNTRTDHLLSLALAMGLGGFVIVLSMIFCWWIDWAEVRKTANKLYAMTDRRAIIWVPSEHAGAVEVHSISARMVGKIHRVENTDGSGDVMFTGRADGPYLNPWGFDGVANVRRVEDLVRQILVNPDAPAEQIDNDEANFM